MTNAIPLTDKRARLAWRLYFMRAESVLAAAPPAVREELLGDLRAHIAELVAGAAEATTERAGLKSALVRVGDPKEFLSPLLETAVEKSGCGWTASAFQMTVYFVTRAFAFSVVTLVVLSVLVVSAAFAVSAFGSMLDPERIGVFLVSESNIRVGTVSDLPSGTYRQLLTPLTALPLMAIAILAIYGAGLAARRLFLRLVVLLISASAHALL
jgi:hypothetical protein